jgi:hypothetical protein
LKILRLSGQAIGGHLFAEQLDVGAFEQISHLMRLACVFTLAEVGGSNSKTTS